MGNRGTGNLSVERADIENSNEQLQDALSGYCPSSFCIDLSARGMRARYFSTSASNSSSPATFASVTNIGIERGSK
jgi:hypothetical protein